jgi:hypothetical protein
MHVNPMREQYLYLSLEHSFLNLDQSCTCVRGPNIPKWPATLSELQSFLPLVKKLPIFGYK